MKRSSKFNTARSLAVATVLVTVGWLIARTWIAQSAIVVSESMAPALLGPHLEVTCPVCGQSTTVAVVDNTQELLDAGHPIACRNCGTLIPLASDTPIRPGDSLLVRRDCSLPPALARWNPIACQDPESPEKIIIKRLVGLPGETVQILDGDVFIDGKIARKSFEQQAAMAVPVYYADHQSDNTASASASTPPRRWIGASKNSRWSVEKGHFCFDGTRTKGMKDKAAERLVYHHRRRVNDRMIAGPVVDQLAYNQWLPIRRDSFRPVTDLMLGFHIRRTAGDGVLKIFTADDRYAVTLDYGKQKVFAEALSSASEKKPPRRLAEAEFHPSADDAPLPILVSTVDRSLMVVVGEKVVLDTPLPEPVPATPTPFSLEAVGLDVDIYRLRIYRDVYYIRPIGIEARWAFDAPVRLGEDEYFLLGDNPRVSRDSRTWPQGPAVNRSAIFGQLLDFTR